VENLGLVWRPLIQAPEKKKSYREIREEQLAAEKAAKEAAEAEEVRPIKYEERRSDRITFCRESYGAENKAPVLRPDYIQRGIKLRRESSTSAATGLHS